MNDRGQCHGTFYSRRFIIQLQDEMLPFFYFLNCRASNACHHYLLTVWASYFQNVAKYIAYYFHTVTHTGTPLMRQLC